jgi:hypothetical protein
MKMIIQGSKSDYTSKQKCLWICLLTSCQMAASAADTGSKYFVVPKDRHAHLFIEFHTKTENSVVVVENAQTGTTIKFKSTDPKLPSSVEAIDIPVSSEDAKFEVSASRMEDNHPVPDAIWVAMDKPNAKVYLFDDLTIDSREPQHKFQAGGLSVTITKH